MFNRYLPWYYKIQILLDLAGCTLNFSYLVSPRENEERVTQWFWSLIRVLESPGRASLNLLCFHHHFGHEAGYNAKPLGKTWIIILALPLTSWVTWGKTLHLSVSLLQLSRPYLTCLPLSAHLIPFCCVLCIPAMLASFWASSMLSTRCFLSLEHFFPTSTLLVSE